MSNSRVKKDVNQSSLLTSLPKDLLLPTQNAKQASSITSVVSESKANKIMSSLSLTCKSMHKLFKPELYKRKCAKLGQYIENANQDKTEAMVKADHSLLFAPLDAVNKNTNQIIKNYTPMQLAYCEDDPEMCLMLKHYFELACGSIDAGREEIQKQLKKKFDEENKEEKEKNEALTKEHLSAMLKPVIQAITNEQFNNGRVNDRDDPIKKIMLSDATFKAIAMFRDEFAASQPKIITSGRRFHLETLLEVCKTYAHQAVQWDYDCKKCGLLEDAVLSFVLGYVSKNDAQRFNQGLYFLQDKGEEFKRAGTTRDGYNFYLVLRGPSFQFSLTGSVFDIIIGRREINRIWKSIMHECSVPPSAVTKLISNKNSKFEELTSRKNNLQNLCTAITSEKVSMRN